MPQFRSREALAEALSNDAEFQQLPDDQQHALFTEMSAQLRPETLAAPRPLTVGDVTSQHPNDPFPTVDPFKVLGAAGNTVLSLAKRVGEGRPLRSPLDQFTTELHGGELGPSPGPSVESGMRTVFSNLPMLLAARPVMQPAMKVAGEAVESLQLPSMKLPDVLQRSRRAKTMEELLAVPDERLHTLPMEQVKQVFEARARQAALGAHAERQALRLQRIEQTKSLARDRQSLNVLLREQSDQAVVKLREVAPQALAQHSEHFRNLIRSDLEKTGSDAISIDAKELIKNLELKFKDRPELLDHVLDRLHLEEFLNEPPSQLAATTPAETHIKARELFDRAQAIRQNIPRSMIEGSSVYTMGHLAEDRVTDAVFEEMERAGVTGLGQARTFWKEWAPTRNTVIRRMGLTGETSRGASFLRRAAFDPGIKRSVQQIEQELGTDLTSEMVQTYQQLQNNQQAKSKLTEELLRAAQHISDTQASLKTGRISEEFAILERSQARTHMRKVLKNLVIGGSVAGVAGAAGLRRLGL